MRPFEEFINVQYLSKIETSMKTYFYFIVCNKPTINC